MLMFIINMNIMSVTNQESEPVSDSMNTATGPKEVEITNVEGDGRIHPPYGSGRAASGSDPLLGETSGGSGAATSIQRNSEASSRGDDRDTYDREAAEACLIMGTVASSPINSS